MQVQQAACSPGNFPDPSRLLALPVINALWVAGGTSSWLRLMEKLFPTPVCKSSVASSSFSQWRPILMKTGLTTLLLNPFYVAFFLCGTRLLLPEKGESRTEGMVLKSEEPKTGPGWALLKGGFASTPIIYGVQYLCIPERLHIPYLCGVNILWSVFASGVTAT